jgi:hypothetical protein
MGGAARIVSTLAAGFLLAGAPLSAAEPIVWRVDDTRRVAGRSVERLGEPTVGDSEVGKAVSFDGVGNALVLDVNPLQGWERFTVEVLLRPAAGGPAEQRLLHIQEDATDNRLLVETRVTPEGRWYLDTFLKSGESRKTLARPDALHPAGHWHWVALVYDGGEMRHFVDGEQEAAAALVFAPLGPGRTSIGARLNRVSWFKGAIREIRLHPRALPGSELQRSAPSPPLR